MSDLEDRLAIASERMKRATAALAPRHKGGEVEEARAAHDDMLRLERLVAASKGEQYAEACDFPVRWDTGAPMPHLLTTDGRALLAFLVSEPDPDWDGSYATAKSPADPGPEPLALVEFSRCVSARLGAPNDEVLSGHPLMGKGLEWYSVQIVVNSRWIKEIEAINSVHSQYRPEAWRGLNHYIFWFHDSTFECIARSFKVETYRESMKELLQRMVERLTSGS